MKITNQTSDEAVLGELGRRLAETRIGRRIEQAELAELAGLSRRTIVRLETGEGGQLASVIRYLRALDRLDVLDTAIPETPPNPIDLLERRGKQRQRVRRRGLSDTRPATSSWTWGDET